MAKLQSHKAVRWLNLVAALLLALQTAGSLPDSASAQSTPKPTGGSVYLPLLSNRQAVPTPTPAKTPGPTPTPSQTPGPVPTPMPPIDDTNTTWFMAGANPQRTSHVASTAENKTEIREKQSPLWYRVIEPYVNQKYQLIAAYDTLFVTSARGIYALSTTDISGDGVAGDLRWVYPLEVPPGHVPTALNGTLFIPGDDHRIHAIEASPDPNKLPIDQATGYRINNRVQWTFEATAVQESDGSTTLGAGFDTNPLVINNTLYAGNRNGYLYAINATTGGLLWKYRTGGPILFSPAASKDNQRIYFASNDAYAYALNAASGQLIWKVGKFPVAGFFTYWPVVYTDNPGTPAAKEYVIFTGSPAYSTAYLAPPYFYDNILALQTDDLFSGVGNGSYLGPFGSEPGRWVNGTKTIDLSKIVEYYEAPTNAENSADPAGLTRKVHKPWRRSFFVLDAANGSELTLDPDKDGQPGYAPIAFTGTKSGGSYPPVLGGDGVLYQYNAGVARPYIPTGEVTGWKFGTAIVSKVGNAWGGWDEPEGYSAGGNILYTYHNGDVYSEAIDLTARHPENRWAYFNMNLDSLVPGYAARYGGDGFGTVNSVYSNGSTRTGPTPYKGVVYYMAANAIIAFGEATGPAVKLPMAKTVQASSLPGGATEAELKQNLATEVQKILAAGHLRAGYHSTGLADREYAAPASNYLLHYFHRPADTFVTLLDALPYLPTSPVNLQEQTRAYLRSEFASYANVTHIGYKNGAVREAFDAPPEISSAMADYGTDRYYPVESFYADDLYRLYGLYRYAQEFGNASTIFAAVRNDLQSPPPDSDLLAKPPIHNAYIAGYIGYLGLERLAGQSESAAARSTLNHLLDLRATRFNKDLAYRWERPFNVADNFINLTPELGEYLRQHAAAKVQTAVAEYESNAPYWFIPKYDATLGEGALQHLYDYPALFAAKAYILQEPRSRLIKHLDAPAFARGDLFYLQNLILTLKAAP